MAMTNGKLTVDGSAAVSSSTSSSSQVQARNEAALRPAERRRRGVEIWGRHKALERIVEDVDASAEEFIKRFRENLLLQRLDSIENYKEMLARGAS
ncbi:hypothetical protein KSP40_PGU016802 [Platanthera guangdongensis]|uniref:Uncharacterized protein n=1 Tax=Platanthera guangdongensis TaxID=2320717 RepID=A0ABR2LC07_9ASPA